MARKQKYFPSHKLALILIALLMAFLIGLDDGLGCTISSLASIPILFLIQGIWCFYKGVTFRFGERLEAIVQWSLPPITLIIIWVLLSRNCLTFTPFIRVSGMFLLIELVSLFLGILCGFLFIKYKK